MQNVYNEILRQPFKTSSHIYPQILKRHTYTYGKDSKRRIKKYIAKRLPHDVHIKEHMLKPYMVRIFANTLNCWMHDLFDNTSAGSPRYWHIFIGVNNRYAIAYPLDSKSSEDIHKSLQIFLQRVRPRKLTSDMEKSFASTENKNLYREYNCQYHFVNSKHNHSPLGIVDRFIRTLRDMNTPMHSDRIQSDDISFRAISTSKMTSLLNAYNNAVHSAINATPLEMYTNPDLEKEYIYECLEHKHSQTRISDFSLKIGQHVRIRLGRGGLGKKRYQYSREKYIISDIRGNMYVVSSKDGNERAYPRYRLHPVSDSASRVDISNDGTYKFGKVLPEIT